MKVKITDPQHKYFGQELEGNVIYFDIHHIGGGGPDLYSITTPEGKMRVLTTQIDEEHYKAQEIARETKSLGANVGDTVKILRSGSCHSKSGFDWKAPHVITDINRSGYVEWDGGEAQSFRPDVEIVSNQFRGEEVGL